MRLGDRGCSAVQAHAAGQLWHAASHSGPRSHALLRAGLASALELQLEGLQDRLHILQARRGAAADAARAQAEAQQLRGELAAAAQQNRTLRATAARLSKVLSAVIERSAAGAGAGGAARRKGGAGGTGTPDAADVLAALTAVEGILGEIQS